MEDDDALTSATCNTCGKRLTRREFRACHRGHFCDQHRKPPDVAAFVAKPASQQVRADGNVAFKVTWVYGASGPFTTPCTSEGRHFNIAVRKMTWCRQAECPCKQMYDAKNDQHYPCGALGQWPCYDCAIFDKWSFGGGVYHGKSRSGDPIPFNNFQLGKLAFFTSRRHDMSEEERIVIGCYRIARAITDPDFDLIVAAAGDYRLKVVNFDKAPRFWCFHRQAGRPFWGTGLFRYLPDEEAEAMLEAIKKVAEEVK